MNDRADWQVEYYFSMQNLAMDFFLRQQVRATPSEIMVAADSRWTPRDGLTSP